MNERTMSTIRLALVASLASASSLAVASLEMTPVTHTETVFRGTNRNLTEKFVKNARMRKLDADNSPAGFTLDEVGLVTTDIADNDTHWTSGRFDNGTHSHNTIHIALGKNMERKGVVHSNLHMDMDIRRPTVMLDGLVVMKDGVFVDSLWEK